MAALLALSVAIGLLAPHLIPLERASALTGIAVWLLALALRAVATVALTWCGSCTVRSLVAPSTRVGWAAMRVGILGSPSGHQIVDTS